MDETFLGPFLAISGLMNDSKNLWEHYMENISRDTDYDSIGNTIQQRLSICRVCVSLHDNLVCSISKINHSFIEICTSFRVSFIRSLTVFCGVLRRERLL